MTNWITNEEGNSTIFTHEGWTVRVGEGWIGVTAPCAGHEVTVDDDGLWVRGADTYAHAEHPESFTIPWEVIAAVVEARAIRG